MADVTITLNDKQIAFITKMADTSLGATTVQDGVDALDEPMYIEVKKTPKELVEWVVVEYFRKKYKSYLQQLKDTMTDEQIEALET